MIAVIIATHSMIISEGYRTNPLGANTITLTVNEEKSKSKNRRLKKLYFGI